MMDLSIFTDRDLELMEVALHAAAQSVQWGASLRNEKDLDPLAREYLVAEEHVMQVQRERAAPPCGDVWMPDEPKVAHITCQRRLEPNGKHRGKHTHYDENGKPDMQWWSGKR